MTREMIITELQNRGYNAEAQTNIKNGVPFEGIKIMTDSNIVPIIYTDDILRRAEEENRDLDEVVEAVIRIYEANRSVDFDVNELFDREFILSNIFIGVQRKGNEKLIKRDCELDGIESYLYIRGAKTESDTYFIKLNVGLLEKVDITEEEAWERAQYNTNEETNIQSMAEVMAEMYGMEYSEEMEERTPFYVISNSCKTRGASAILNKEALAQFGKKHNVSKVIVLPSSVHEMLLIPYERGMDLEEYSTMVSEVNATEVNLEERLTDRAYIVTV